MVISGVNLEKSSHGLLLRNKRKHAMTKEECKMKLKHELEISRRLQEVGLYRAATESRNKAQILLQAYKRHFLEESVIHHQ